MPSITASPSRRRAERILLFIIGVLCAGFVVFGEVRAQDEEPTDPFGFGGTSGGFDRARETRPSVASESREGEQLPRATGTSAPDRIPLDRVIDRETYRLGPGDGLVASLWGTTNAAFNLAVTPEGDVVMPGVGPVRVSGLTVAVAEERIREASRGVYQDGRLTVSLVALRTFRVHLSGFVKEPGAQVVTAAFRVSDAIELSGGLSQGASRRRIVLRRATGEQVLVDFDEYRLNGKMESNPPLELGDAIHVPATGDNVEISGAINRSGPFEFRPGDTVNRIIGLAGGLRDDAQRTDIEWATFIDDTAPGRVRVVSLDEVGDTPVRPGDRIFVKSRSDWRRRTYASIIGEVVHPGSYPIIEGRTRLADVVARAGGITGEASLGVSTFVRGEASGLRDPELARLAQIPPETMKDREYAYLVTRQREIRGQILIDFRRALDDPASWDNLVLRDGDQIHIERNPGTIEIVGQVSLPGLIDFTPGRSVGSYIDLAGGFAANANRRGIRIIKLRTGLWTTPGSGVVIEPGDTIFIPEREPVSVWNGFKEGVLVASQIATLVLLFISLK